MGNEIRYYLGEIKRVMAEGENPATGEPREPFKPQVMVTAVKLPTGSIEIAINHDNIPEKIDYILEAYDADMHLKSNTEVVMQNLMVV